MQRHFGSKGIAQSATGGDPSRLEKAGRSRICLSVEGKHLKADCGFGLDDSKSPDALLLRCSDAQMHFCPDAQMPRCPDALLLRCSDAQMPFCPDAQMPRCPFAQMLKCPDALLLRCSAAQMPFCSDAQLPRSVKTAIAVLTGCDFNSLKI